jgi:nicotinate phosphoribosyltransferase
MISGLMTDFYELTMMQGYYLSDNNPQVVFDMFYRSQPFGSGYAVFAGLEDALEGIQSMSFTQEDIAFLKDTGRFGQAFLDYLSDYRFSGTVYAMDEGSIMFPGEPIVRIEASLIEAQLIESFLLNTINFQSLIATKTSRIYNASKGGMIMEFGLRRAQGLDGARSATRASYIGGSAVTSNTFAGKELSIPVSGTMAHSWVMSYESELESFREFARIYPDHSVLLIDTYDTLGTGIQHAITVGKELQKQGKRMGVRIDSGDLSYLSKEVRSKLDEAGLTDAFIAVSNDLHEQIIELLVNDEVPIDSWGVGTHMVTGGSQASMNGVYKLAAKQDSDGIFQPTMKVSNNYEKTTNPGIKQVYRFFDKAGMPKGDLITLEDEHIEAGRSYTLFHPMIDKDFYSLGPDSFDHLKPLLSCKMHDGLRLGDIPQLSEIRALAISQLSMLHTSYKRLINPHIYKVSLSRRLKDLKQELINTYRRQQGQILTL